MAQIANVEYFKNYCNYKLGTKYTWNSKEPINLYWTTKAVQKIYNDIHQPKTGCTLHLSTRFNLDESIGLIAVDTTFVNDVINYLVNFNKICDVDCPCPCGWNCSPDNCYNCKHCGTCDRNTCAHCHYINSACYPSNCRACGWYIHCWQYCNGNSLNVSSVVSYTVRTCQRTDPDWACLRACNGNCQQCG